MTSEPLGVGLVGCGTVGAAVADLLLAHPDRLAARGGRPLALRRVAVRDTHKARPVALPAGILGTDPAAVARAADVDVVVELIGGTDTARRIVLDALAAGKHVVTANKALLATHGPEVFATAREAGRAVCFEAAVAGGIPIIRALAESLAANQVTAIQGILNGTCNFILTRMAEGNASYAAALAEAQRLGYAEADPTLDVDGSDAAHKLAVLAQIAFGVTAAPGDIERTGIDHLDAMDVRFAAELGYTVKLLAEAWTSDSQVAESQVPSRHGSGLGTWDSATCESKTVALHVSPVMIRQTDMLARVRGAHNAVQVIGDVVGETLYQGPGAGARPTASSVVADLIDLAVGRAQRTFAAAGLWDGAGRGFVLARTDRVRSRFYLRLLVADRPGVLADVSRALAAEGISIASVIQHEPAGDEPAVPLVLLTHAAETGRFRAAVRAIGGLPGVATAPVAYPVAG
jgi:homoserine dehydrogenase